MDQNRGQSEQVAANAEIARWGSDHIADVMRALELEYVTLTPGASFRGLHDSLVNYLGNERPTMLLALHEESAVAIAHGYAKVTGKPLGVVLHSNVGLMHASMAIFNAWCERVPMLIYGGNGNDQLAGNEGNDELHGDAGDDELDGGTGNDELYGGTGNDLGHGGEGNDLVYGGADNDELYGGAGNDLVDGGTGIDDMYGGTGRDRLVVRERKHRREP